MKSNWVYHRDAESAAKIKNFPERQNFLEKFLSLQNWMKKAIIPI